MRAAEPRPATAAWATSGRKWPRSAPPTLAWATPRVWLDLEVHTKIAGHPVVLDVATQNGLAGRVATVSLGAMAIRGKAAEVPVFAVKAAR